MNLNLKIMTIKGLENIDLLIITNEFLLDNAIVLFGNLSQFDGKIKRVYFSLESTPMDFNKKKLQKKSLKNPRNITFISIMMIMKVIIQH